MLEVKRVSWANLLFAVGSLIGIWAIIGVLSGAGDSLAAIKGASWGWVALTFLFAQLPVVAEGWALLGAATRQCHRHHDVAPRTASPFDRCRTGIAWPGGCQLRFDAAAREGKRCWLRNRRR